MSRRPSLPWLALALLGGLVAGLLVMRGDAAPELTSADLAGAQQRWSENGPADYRITLQMGGALSDLRQIEVRDHQVVAMMINDRPASESSWNFWSVDGMFQFLADEIRNRENPIPGMGVSDPRQIILRARFDSDLGYPVYFLRHLLGRQQGTEWEVISFEPRPESDPS